MIKLKTTDDFMSVKIEKIKRIATEELVDISMLELERFPQRKAAGLCSGKAEKSLMLPIWG